MGSVYKLYYNRSRTHSCLYFGRTSLRHCDRGKDCVRFGFNLAPVPVRSSYDRSRTWHGSASVVIPILAPTKQTKNPHSFTWRWRILIACVFESYDCLLFTRLLWKSIEIMRVCSSYMHVHLWKIFFFGFVFIPLPISFPFCIANNFLFHTTMCFCDIPNNFQSFVYWSTPFSVSLCILFTRIPNCCFFFHMPKPSQSAIIHFSNYIPYCRKLLIR